MHQHRLRRAPGLHRVHVQHRGDDQERGSVHGRSRARARRLLVPRPRPRQLGSHPRREQRAKGLSAVHDGAGRCLFRRGQGW